MNPLRLVVNNVQRRLDTMFPGYFMGSSPKHDHFKDFGYPEQLSFTNLYRMCCRNGVASAGVDKTILKTWQDSPFLLEKERDGSQGGGTKETTLEKQIRQRFDDLRLWTRLAEADRMSMVGKYAGVILRFADSKPFNQPVDKVPGGLDGLVEIIPAWEGQLQVSQWDTDETSETYGQPTMFQFNESAVDTNAKQPRNLTIHPDRVIVWSKDGTVNGSSALEPGYNALVDMEKVRGAGGEGFWKNAKSAPVLEIDKEAKPLEMAKQMGIKPEDLADKMNDQVADWNAGFDQLLMVMGMQAKTLNVTLPSPEHFYAIALQDFSASMNMPVKILVGMQTGERASQEDAAEWAQTNMSRRANQTVPNIMSLVNRLERVGILPEKDWYLDWTDLTEASIAEKIERANKMADVNTKLKDSGEWGFTPEEIRMAAGYEPLSDAEKYVDDVTDEERGLPSNAPPTEEE
ncbi:anti-CBASS protein Acb1 family protein [Shinella sp.]|uniref:anti-CBASS protein Acb1 family protein n=1 Tax=Shinella sp. TaxID=1870904 RepID=UPI0028B03898|nr:anti-CBASS Acb1 family protein [Shinella sp.]